MIIQLHEIWGYGAACAHLQSVFLKTMQIYLFYKVQFYSCTMRKYEKWIAQMILIPHRN